MTEDELNRQRFRNDDNVLRLRQRKPEEVLVHASLKSLELQKENRALKKRLSDVRKRERRLKALLRETIGRIDDEVQANAGDSHPVIDSHGRVADKARRYLDGLSQKDRTEKRT